jgi:hypothetical protein
MNLKHATQLFYIFIWNDDGELDDDRDSQSKRRECYCHDTMRSVDRSTILTVSLYWLARAYIIHFFSIFPSCFCGGSSVVVQDDTHTDARAVSNKHIITFLYIIIIIILHSQFMLL